MNDFVNFNVEVALGTAIMKNLVNCILKLVYATVRMNRLVKSSIQRAHGPAFPHISTYCTYLLYHRTRDYQSTVKMVRLLVGVAGGVFLADDDFGRKVR